jgi:hypothetical protein
MVHLAVSRRVRELNGIAVTPAYLLGSLSPDAIHMRAGSTRTDKDHTHLLDLPDRRSYRPIHDFWQSRPGEFAQGYASHLLADRMWMQPQWQPFLRLAPGGASPQEMTRRYYAETDWIDLDLYTRMPWRQEAWEQLAAAQAVDLHPLLNADEIDRWRTRTLDWYEEHKGDALNEPVLITPSIVAEFIESAARRIAGYVHAWNA